MQDFNALHSPGFNLRSPNAAIADDAQSIQVVVGLKTAHFGEVHAAGKGAETFHGNAGAVAQRLANRVGRLHVHLLAIDHRDNCGTSTNGDRVLVATVACCAA